MIELCCQMQIPHSCTSNSSQYRTSTLGTLHPSPKNYWPLFALNKVVRLTEAGPGGIFLMYSGLSELCLSPTLFPSPFWTGCQQSLRKRGDPHLKFCYFDYILSSSSLATLFVFTSHSPHPVSWPVPVYWPCTVYYFLSLLWILPDAFGCSLFHIYNKNLSLNQWSSYQFIYTYMTLFKVSQIKLVCKLR